MQTELDHEHPLVEKPTAELWGENFALAASDPANGLAIFYSIGTWYQDTSVWREMLAVPLPDGRVLIGRNYGRNTAGAVVSASLSRYEILEHERRVRLTWKGPVWNHSAEDLLTRGLRGGLAKLLDLDVTFEAIAPIWDPNAASGVDPTNITGSFHTEQLGRCSGHVRYDGREFAVKDAIGCRDHSRGQRNMGPYKEHAWINGWFPSGRGFHIYAANLYTVEGPAMAKAVVVDGGKLHAAKLKHVEFIKGPQDARGLHHVVIESELGEMRVDISKVLTNLTVSAVPPFEAQPGILEGEKHILMFDESVELRWNGETGIGWSERGCSERLQ